MPVTWNPADKNALIALSGSNLVATSNAGAGTVHAAVRATQAISTTVKQYFELTVTGTLGQAFCLGVMNDSASLSLDVAGTNGAAYFNNVAASKSQLRRNGTYQGVQLPLLASGQVVRIAYDYVSASKRIWWAINTNQWTSGATPWMGSGGTTDDPATATGGYDLSLVTGTIYPAISSVWTGDVATANFGATAFAYTPPTGFVGLDTLAAGGASQARAMVLA